VGKKHWRDFGEALVSFYFGRITSFQFKLLRGVFIDDFGDTLVGTFTVTKHTTIIASVNDHIDVARMLVCHPKYIKGYYLLI
jgi:hypothetical protein